MFQTFAAFAETGKSLSSPLGGDHSCVASLDTLAKEML